MRYFLLTSDGKSMECPERSLLLDLYFTTAGRCVGIEPEDARERIESGEILRGRGVAFWAYPKYQRVGNVLTMPLRIQ